MVFVPSFRSWIHFELMFVCGVRQGPDSFFHLWIPRCASTFGWKDNSFPVDCLWHLCWKLIGHRVIGLFLDSSFYPSRPCLSSCQRHCLALFLITCLLSLGSRFWSRKVWFLQFCVSFPRWFCLLWVPSTSLWVFGQACLFLQRSLLGFWQRLHWVYRSDWDVLSLFLQPYNFCFNGNQVFKNTVQLTHLEAGKRLCIM